MIFTGPMLRLEGRCRRNVHNTTGLQPYLDNRQIMAVSPGVKLGPYEILALIGAGGMGQVYRARDTRLGRIVALKVHPADICADPGRKQRFEREAQASTALNHPNIVSIIDVGTANDTSYIVTELVVGETLRSVLNGGSIEFRQLLDIAVQMADGLAAAHSAGIVHRDLKPENVMLTQDGRVKILVFGLAKTTGQMSSDTTELLTATEPGMVLGTMPYLSPEQARGSANLDGRSWGFLISSSS